MEAENGMTPQPSEQPHPVWAGGPPCSPQCPGDWSDFHYGYSAGFEAAAPDPVASPTGYWEASGELTPDVVRDMGPILEEATASRKPLVVHEGITLRWRSAVASPAPLDVERLARALQSTILTSIDEYMGPGGGAYRAFWDEMTDPQKRHVMQDAAALAAEYEREGQPVAEEPS